MPSSVGTDADKRSLRRSYKALRAAQSPQVAAQSDAHIHHMLSELSWYREASCVLTYVGVGSEVATLPLIQEALDQGRIVAVPRCDTEHKQLDFIPIHTLEDLSLTELGLLEPREGTPLRFEELVGSVCLVPGLVFDGAGHRIGYGGGYYDRFLAHYPGMKIGLARSWQISSNELPHEAYDIALDYLVCETQIATCMCGLR